MHVHICLMSGSCQTLCKTEATERLLDQHDMHLWTVGSCTALVKTSVQLYFGCALMRHILSMQDATWLFRPVLASVLKRVSSLLIDMHQLARTHHYQQSF